MREISKKILMIFIEPTPYKLALISKINTAWPNTIDVIFLTGPQSQNWNFTIEPYSIILPKNTLERMKILYQYVMKGDYKLFFLAGWYHPICLTSLLWSKLLGIPTTVYSDTPLSPYTPVWRRIIKRIIYPLLLKLPSILLPGGSRQAKYLEYYGVPPQKMVHEKMTVDVLAIQKYIKLLPTDAKNNIRQRFDLKPDDVVFLFVGRLIKSKGIEKLLQIFLQLKNDRAKLLVVGNGPLKTNVEIAAQDSTNIHYAGFLEKEALLDCYYLSDVFVLPVQGRESWGLVVNEAMAVGKPVIVTDEVGCVDDLVIQHKTGIVIQSACSESLQQAILYLCENPEEREKMSQAALQLISTWTMENEAQQIIYAWKKLL